MKLLASVVVGSFACAANAQLTYESRISNLDISTSSGLPQSDTYLGIPTYDHSISSSAFPGAYAHQRSTLTYTTISFEGSAAGGGSGGGGGGGGSSFASSELVTIFTLDGTVTWTLAGIAGASDLASARFELWNDITGAPIFSHVASNDEVTYNESGHIGYGRYRYRVFLSGGDSMSSSARVAFSVIPAPSSLGLLGMVAFAGRRRR